MLNIFPVILNNDDILSIIPVFRKDRYLKAVILTGANAAGKTSLGKALLKIFNAVNETNEAYFKELVSAYATAAFQVDFVNEGFTLHRISGTVNKQNVELQYFNAEIGVSDSYEKTVSKLKDHSDEISGNLKKLKKAVGTLNYRFAYPEIESSLKLSEIKNEVLLKTLRAVIGTLDPTLTDISMAKDLKDSFIIRRHGQEIIIQEGKLLTKDILSSGTAEGIDVSIFLASMLSGSNCFYYCDGLTSHIQCDIEKRIFGLMLERLGKNDQLIFTTHNNDMLDLNLPKHTFAFLKKEIDNGEYKVSAVFASDILKRNTDSVKCALENDVFGSIPDDHLLDELEA